MFDPPGKVKFDADELPFDKLAVKGNTLATPPLTLAKVTHTVPQASGVLRITGFLTMPRIGRTRWFCVTDQCFDFNGMVFDGTVDVRVRNLRQLRDPTPFPDDGTLPPPSALYEKSRREDQNHLDEVAFAGTAFTLQTLPLIAEHYFSSSGRILSVNDISLPKGGVFDLKLNWKGGQRNPDGTLTRFGHVEHREGNDVDINRRDPISGIELDCKPDHALRLAVDQFLEPQKRKDNRLTALLCESRGRNKHLDMEPFGGF